MKIDRNSIHDPVFAWFEIYQQLAKQGAIRNVNTQLQLEQIGDEWVPATLNQSEYDNSYVCSPYTAYISYAKQELKLLRQPLLEKTAAITISFASIWLKTAKINQTLSINNWLLSTNLPGDWSPTDLQSATEDWRHRYPNHLIQVRSLNAKHHQTLLNHLTHQDWLIVPARQVFLFDGAEEDWWRRNNCKNDQRLLRKTPLELVNNEAITQTDYVQIEYCFNQLFIEKHSTYNPQLTVEFIQALHQAGLVHFEGFRNAEGKLVGVVGFFSQRDIVTVPILGYDTQLPQSLGLYRLLITLALKHAHETGKRLNLSSGAGHFKTLRGGQVEIEYNAFYINHLSIVRRLMLKAFFKLINRPLIRLFSNRIF